MTIKLALGPMRSMFPRAPQGVIDAFVAKQNVLDDAGINHTRNRLAYCLAQLEHETSGFTRMREGTTYTAERAHAVFPRYFPTVADAQRYVGDPRLFFNKVYGGRMGNRPGTDDGYDFIGRGGPQITGRDGYENAARHSGVAFDVHPEWAARADTQPELAAGFVSWKKLNAKADLGDFKGYVKIWNGGLNGYADREQILAGNDPFIARLEAVERIDPITRDLPGKPPTAEPPPEVIEEATKKERTVRKIGGAAGGAGSLTSEGTKTESTTVGTTQPMPEVQHFGWTPSLVTVGIVAITIIVLVAATIIIERKRATILSNWN